MKHATSIVWGLTLTTLAGCDASSKPVENPALQPPAPAAAPLEPAAVVPPPAEPAADAAAEMVREKAEVGVGEKGNDQSEGLYSTPVKAYFRAKEQVAFNVQIPSNMNLYKAEHGHAPRTHEEFMEKIVKAGMIRLPELPAGHRYVYDPEKEELLVEHP
jgi:hypothetical protein